MSTETDFLALLKAHAPLDGAVASISLNAAPERGGYPLVVFTAAHSYDGGLDGSLVVDEVSFTVTVWAKNPAAAEAVADHVTDACATAPPVRYCAVVSRETVYDGDADLDGVELTVEWTA